MRKQDLIPGVEYAITFDENHAKRRYGRTEVRRATFVGNGTVVHDTVTTIGFAPTYSRNDEIRPYAEGAFENGEKQYEISETGLVVDLDEPVRRGRISPSGRYVEGSYGFRGRGIVPDPVEMYGDGKDVEDFEPRMVTAVALKSGGCFVSTWADHEAEQADAARRKAEQKAEFERRTEEAHENDEKVRDDLRRVVAEVISRGYEARFDYGYEQTAETSEVDEIVFTKADDHTRQLVIEPVYFNARFNPDPGTPMTGWNVKTIRPELLVDLLRLS